MQQGPAGPHDPVPGADRPGPIPGAVLTGEPDSWENAGRGIGWRVAVFVLPLLLIAAHGAVLWLFLPPDWFVILSGITIAYILPPAGKESAIPLGIALGLPWWLPALSIAVLDCEFGLFMVLNYDLIEEIPLFGKWIAGFRHKAGDFVDAHPWFRRAAFSGIIVLVMSPVLGSGGIRGSIIGRMLGLSRGRVLLAIGIGAFAGSFGIAIGFEYLWVLLSGDPLVRAALILVLVAAAIAAWLVYRRCKGNGAGGPGQEGGK